MTNNTPTPQAITGETSDGYHTFNELYNHRHVLWINYCSERVKTNQVWRSRKHSDGSSFDGWFVLGMNKHKGEQITYHLPEDFWIHCEFAETLEQAPDFDGHTSNDVFHRLLNLL